MTASEVFNTPEATGFDRVTPDKITNVPSLPHEPVVTDTNIGSGTGGNTMTPDKRVEEIRKKYVETWDSRQFEWNHHDGDGGLKPISPERIWQIFIEPTLTQYHQDLMSEVVEKLNLKMAPRSNDPYSNEFEHGYDRGIYDAIETLTEAQTIIKSLSK